MSMMWILLQLFVIIIDQLTKLLIIKAQITVPVTMIPNFFYIGFGINGGAAWGMFQNGRYVLIAFTVIALIVLNYIISKHKIGFLNIALSLVAGGAAGNLIDRIGRGGVVDFLDFYIGSYHYPTFNVADSCIVVGTALLMYYVLFYSNRKVETNENNKSDR